MSSRPTENPEDIFPTKGAIPEEKQIGRDAVFNDIAGRVVEGDDLIIAQPRRIGKTSTIKNGALPRVRSQYDGVIAQIDLRQADVRDEPVTLAAALQKTALATGADKAIREQALKRIGQKTKRFVHGDRAKAAAALTDETALAKTVQGIATVLVGAENPIDALRATLTALEADAQRYGRPVVVFIDEVQDLGDPKRWPKWGQLVQEELARAMLREGRLMSFVFCGSEQHAMEQLFASGQPLHHEGERYRLPTIADEDWTEQISARYAGDGRAITPEQISVILEAAGRRAGRTMRVCKALLRIARAVHAGTITDAMVDQAIDEAKAHPSWM